MVAALQGALTSSLIMTIRQFLSILINAGIFGNFASVSMLGWTGVFWYALARTWGVHAWTPPHDEATDSHFCRVASGIWIKINRTYDSPNTPQLVTSSDTATNEAKQGLLMTSTEKSAVDEAGPAQAPTIRVKQSKWAFPYLLGLGPGPTQNSFPGAPPPPPSAVLMQYLIPIAIPAVAAMILAPFVQGDGLDRHLVQAPSLVRPA